MRSLCASSGPNVASASVATNGSQEIPGNQTTLATACAGFNPHSLATPESPATGAFAPGAKSAPGGWSLAAGRGCSSRFEHAPGDVGQSKPWSHYRTGSTHHRRISHVGLL